MKILRRWLIIISFVVLSGPLRAQIAARPGSALDLDGTNSYALATNGVWFNGDFTIEGWVFVRSYNSWSRLIDFADGPNTNNVYLALSAGNNGFPAMGVFTNNNGTPAVQATTQLPLNQWTHLAATLRGTTGTIYINGTPVGSGTLNIPPNVVRTNNYIGRSNYSTDGYANALFDELRIWNVARTQSQIQAGMHRSLVGNETGLVAYWRMDEASGTTLTDSSGNGRTATLFGGATWSNSTAPLMAGAGSALNFNPTLGQFVSVSNQVALNAFPITVMTWFKIPTTNTAGGGALVNKYASASLNGYQIFLGGQLKAWYIRDSANNVYDNGTMVAGPVNDGLWHHAAMVVDTNGGRLYLDGTLKSSVPWTGTPGPPTTTNALVMGLYPGDSFLNGQVDEVSIWNTAFSAAQIQSVMNHPLAGSEPGLAGYWRLDEGAGTNTMDATTNGFNGTLLGNPTWVNSGAPLVVPDPGYGLNLNGVNAYLQVSNGVWFNGPFTIEGWVYTRSYNNWSRLLDFGNGQYFQDVYFALSGGTSGYPTLGIFNNGSQPVLTSTDLLPLNQWAHLACTFDGTNGAIYINGNLSAFGPIPVIPSNVVRTNNYLGKSAFTDAYANATFDEVRIWNVARSQFQIQETMSRPLTGGEPGLVGYWRFDDSVGTNAVDGTGKGNNATLINSPIWTVSGVRVNFATGLTPVPATNITSSSATLQALVNPNGSSTTVYFSYGTNLSYGTTNVVANVGSGIDPVLVTNNISGLVGGTVYHFQISASNNFGLTTGVDQTFLATDPPGVTTLAATAITATTVTLNGTLNPFGADAFAWFQYGLTTNYDGLTTSTLVPGTNQTAVSISNVISSLYPGIPYHFRLVGSNVNSTVFGADLTFTPPATPPGISDQYASSVALSNTVLNASVTVNGADTTAWFQFGTTTNYDGITTSTNISGTNLAPVSIDNTISNLSAGVIYHFQLVATNDAGASYGGDQLFATPAFALSNTALPAVFLGSMAWGDFDNDGLMDVLISGATTPSGSSPITQVWRNTGNGFSFYADLPGISHSSVAVGDYDNDGLLDILIAGYDSGNNPIAQVWHNTGNGFVNINAGLPGVAFCSVAWGDYDNDGRLDILLSGLSNGGPITQVWRNTGNGFTNINAGLPGIYYSSVAWGDYDNDGLPDILLSGLSNDGPITQIWRNTGNGFTNINAPFPSGAYYSAGVAWGDYDNDGRLDVLLSAGSYSDTEVWRNTGDGFTNINADLPGFSQGCVVWGDFNGDGKLDILLSGADSGYNPHTQLWLNTGNGFVQSPELPGVYYTSAAFGDYDNDGRLDLLVSGLTHNAYVFTTQLWLNQTTPTNSPPTAPSGLSAALSGSLLKLSWNASSDLQTATPGLSYNLRVGTIPGGSDILGPMAVTNGTRLLPQRGNIQSTQTTIPLPASVVPGTALYWTVQSIDTSFTGSSFAPETSIVVKPFFNSSGRRSDGVFQAQFDVQSGTNYTIQASTDLVHWSDLLDFTFGNSGPVLFTDPDATNYPTRFYRFGQY